MDYIYDRGGWPHFTWDQEKISPILLKLRHEQGRLIGGMESVGFDLRENTILATITQDVLKSSEIEGENLDHTQVRSSVARRLGIESAAVNHIDRKVEGIVDMMLDATQNFDHPLTKERLFRWHASLFPDGRSGWQRIHAGGWRKGAVEVVSGPLGKERVHFEGPPPEKIDYEMSQFLQWFNQKSSLDPVLKSAIAHFWFVTIHPFEDGNGRIGRAIGDLLLARSEQSSHRFYSLSAQTQLETKHYYAILENSQKGYLDITPWIEWFLSCLSRAIEKALSIFHQVLEKGHFWERLKEVTLNERQRKVLNRLLDGFDGKLSSSKWAKITKCSQDTAHRDILDLIDKGVLKKNPGEGRNTSYSLMDTLSAQE